MMSVTRELSLLQIGGVTCCASGIYAVEYNLKWSRQRWDERDGLISQVVAIG